ncbi:MAG: hypothetical protein AAFZ63_09825 [Bacteroidota bacterium]
MKALFLLSTIFLSGIFTPTHEIPLAVFHITASGELLEVDITFDVEDYSKSLGITTAEINLEGVQTYLNEKTIFQFNAQVASLTISEVRIVRDHIKIKGSFREAIKSIDTIKIENNCLNNIPRHSNVILIDLNDDSRDFRMHNKRTVITLNY